MDASSRSAVAARPPPKETYRRAGRGDPSAGSAVREAATTARSINARGLSVKLTGEGFKLELLESATAHHELNG
jgi:hypothetical protein